eukprot:Mrub_02984.p4 GENE.Mrub_02984~~Mrub_02984.p4  ORF type:complete len:153 (-),score=19.88 Mrub_02984:824-1282(-)
MYNAHGSTNATMFAATLPLNRNTCDRSFITTATATAATFTATVTTYKCNGFVCYADSSTCYTKSISEFRQGNIYNIYLRTTRTRHATLATVDRMPWWNEFRMLGLVSPRNANYGMDATKYKHQMQNYLSRDIKHILVYELFFNELIITTPPT